MNIIIYCDGACSGNPGIGGCATLINLDSEEIEQYDWEQQSTNQRMEIRAAALGLHYLTACSPISTIKYSTIEVHSDSAYVVNCMKQEWYKKWQSNGWINSQKQPVANKELWINLLEETEALEGAGCQLQWVKEKGHAGVALNERADTLAVTARTNKITKIDEGI